MPYLIGSYEFLNYSAFRKFNSSTNALLSKYTFDVDAANQT